MPSPIDRDAFYTPDWLADYVAARAAALASGQTGSWTVLEPSAGDGAIVRAVRRAGFGHVIAVEPYDGTIEDCARGDRAVRVVRERLEVFAARMGPRFGRRVIAAGNTPYRGQLDRWHAQLLIGTLVDRAVLVVRTTVLHQHGWRPLHERLLAVTHLRGRPMFRGPAITDPKRGKKKPGGARHDYSVIELGPRRVGWGPRVSWLDCPSSCLEASPEAAE